MNYLVFACDQYYPEGGWSDYIGHAESIDEAKRIVESLATETAVGGREPLEWAQIVDTHCKEIVLKGETDGLGSLKKRLQDVDAGGKWYNWEPVVEGEP